MRSPAGREPYPSVADADEDPFALGCAGGGHEGPQRADRAALPADEPPAVVLRNVDVVDEGLAFETLGDARLGRVVAQPAHDRFDQPLHFAAASATGSGRASREAIVGETLAPFAIHCRARSRSKESTGGFGTGSYEPSSSRTSARAVRRESETTIR